MLVAGYDDKYLHVSAAMDFGTAAVDLAGVVIEDMPASYSETVPHHTDESSCQY